MFRKDIETIIGLIKLQDMTTPHLHQTKHIKQHIFIWSKTQTILTFACRIMNTS